MQDVRKVIETRQRYGFATRPPCTNCRTGNCESQRGNLHCLECWYRMLTPQEFDAAQRITTS